MDTIAKVRSLINAIREAESRTWKVVRKALLEIEDLGGPALLGYSTFKEFVEGEFIEEGKCFKNFSTYSNELTCGALERVIGVASCTYSRDSLRPYFQFRIKVGCGIQQLGSYKCKLAAAESVRACWAIATQIAAAAGRVPNEKDIALSVDRFREKHPDKVKKTSRSINGPARWRKRYEQASKELALAKQRLAGVLREASQYQEELQRLRLTNSQLEKQIEQLSQANQGLAFKRTLTLRQLEKVKTRTAFMDCLEEILRSKDKLTIEGIADELATRYGLFPEQGSIRSNLEQLVEWGCVKVTGEDSPRRHPRTYSYTA